MTFNFIPSNAPKSVTDKVHRLLSQNCKTRGINVTPFTSSPYLFDYDADYLLKKTITDSVKKYLKLNPLNTLNIKNHVNPILFVDKKEIRRNCVLKKEVIESDRIIALKGEYGVFAKKFIPRNSCLGMFDGLKRTEMEMQRLWENSTSIYNPINRNSFEMYLEHHVIDKIKELTMKDKELLAPSQVEQFGQQKQKMIKIVVDPLTYNTKKTSVGDNELITQYINDPRKNIYKSKMSKEDLQRLNCAVVQVNIKHFPHLFVFAMRDIKMGEELFISYGKRYILKKN